MTRHVVVSGAFALALAAASAAHAATDADLTQIRDEIRQLKESYEARIQALEQRLKDAEARTAGTPRDCIRAAGHRGERTCARAGPCAGPCCDRRRFRRPQRPQRVQPRDLGGAAGRLCQPVAGSE